ncbi:hypothetical protein MCEMRE196_00489 [Candidatus Nanopelagicaceae bacterium]
MGHIFDFEGFGVMHTFEKYYICSYPQLPLESIDHLVLDTMVLSDIYDFANGKDGEGYITSGFLDLIRNTSLHVNTAVVERNWQHQIDTTAQISDYVKPKANLMAEGLELLHFIKFSSNNDFAKFKNGTLSLSDIPKEFEYRNKESLAFGFNLEEFISMIAQNWLGIALLLKHEVDAPSRLTEPGASDRDLVSKQIDAYKSWQRDVRGFGIGISLELRLLSNLAFFGGYMPGLHGNKVTFDVFAKKDEWATTKKSRIARNIAFDFQQLSIARQSRMGFFNNSVTVPRKFAAVLTRDKVLAATVGFVAQEALAHGVGIHAPYKWPIDSDFLKIYEERFAFAGFYGPSRASQDLIESIDIVPALERVLMDLDADK